MCKLVLFATLAALSPSLVLGDDDYCFGKDNERPQTRHFTSKTAYQIIKGTNVDKLFLVPGCQPQKMWILHRHGTRLPAKNTIQKAPRLELLRDEIVDNYRVRRSKPTTNALCQEDLIALQMWKWNNSITVDQENYLTSQGYDDLRGTGKLYQKYYPDVLTKPYNSSVYLFRHTNTQRTHESFKAFAEGIFGTANGAHAHPVPEEDLLLRPYDYCESWKAHDYSGPNSECHQYRQSRLWNLTITDVSTRLGFLYTLESSDVELMYDVCRYEQAWQIDRTSVWCAAFTPEQVTVLEYEDDMKYFYKSGYGYEENTRLSCRVVQDMLRHMKSDSLPNVVAYFGHSTGVQTFITALGINKDDIKLTATNYNELTQRRWRTSNIDPFAANFVAAKYKCDALGTDQEKLLFFLNQYAVDLDWCHVGLCDLSEVLKRFKAIGEADCDRYYCDEASSVRVASLGVLLLLIVDYLIY